MTKILLVRHGYVEGIEPPRFRGRTDLPLTLRGEAEARAVARRIAAGFRPAIVYTSPLRRCVVTGDEVAKACGVGSAIMEELNDLDYGSWQFCTYDEIQQAYPREFAAWLATPHLVRFPGGNSLQDLVARSADALRFVIQRHAEEAVVLVSHDSVNRALLLQLLDQPLSTYWRLAQTPCCINEIDIVNGAIRVVRLNETEHLG